MLKAFFKFLFGGDEGCAEAGKSCCAGHSPKRAAAPRGDGKGVGIAELEKFVEYVVCALVDAPSEVKLATEEVDDGYVIRITCRKDDIGKIVGKRGKTIMAIRSLVSGAAGRLRKHIAVEVLD